jgi:hypothetical protein
MKRISGAIVVALLLTVWAVSVVAQVLHPGERLDYVVAYRAKLIPNTEMATVTVQTSLDSLDGRPTYRVMGNGRIMPSYRWFFNIDDRYDIWVDTLSKRTLRFESNIREGDYTFRSHYRYDWDSLQVHTWAQSRQRAPREKTMPLSERSMDPVSSYFNLRSIEPDTLVAGRHYDLEMVLEDTIKVLKFRLMGREECRVPQKGRFRTLHLRCTLGTSEGFSFTDGSEFDIWITDDRNKFPVMLSSPIRIGSIRAYITDYRGLKYPLDSRIK